MNRRAAKRKLLKRSSRRSIICRRQRGPFFNRSRRNNIIKQYQRRNRINQYRIKNFGEDNKDLIIKAENCIFNEFPEKILEINKVLQYPEFSFLGLKDTKYGIDPAVILSLQQNANRAEREKNASATCLNETINETRTNNVVIKAHEGIVELTKLIKPFFIQLDTDVTLVKMWLTELMPAHGSSNSFVTRVQENIFRLVTRIELSYSSFFNKITSYSNYRSTLIDRLLKYPFIEDYQQFIEFEDEKQHLYLACSLKELRNSYLIINDIIVKNLEKIKSTKSESENYY